MLSIFSCAYWPSVFLLWRNVYLGLLPIFGLGCLFFLLSCMSCLCILEIKHLSVALFANMFSHSLGCLYFFYKFIYLFMAALGLCCCVWAFLASRGYSSLWCVGFSLWWLLLLRSTGFSSCGLWALEHRLSSCAAQA